MFHPHSLQQLKDDIETETAIFQDKLCRACTNIVRRCQACSEAVCQHFENILRNTVSRTAGEIQIETVSRSRLHM